MPIHGFTFVIMLAFRTLTLISFFFGCFLTSEIIGQNKITPIEYIHQYKEIAMEEMRVHNVPASITLAQGCLESSYGNSRLAKDGNNHFGIKCKKTWTGNVIYEDDDAVGECFRAYDNAASSYADHSLFLKNNSRYDFLFQLSISDYKGWSYGLRQAGYATNPRYPQLLIDMVERYNLAKYDTLVLGLYNVSSKINGVLATRMQEGQSLEAIGIANDRTANRLRKLNDLSPGQEIEPGDIVYLRRKKRKASDPYYEVLNGQSLWTISQEHGIKLKRLYKLNQLEQGEEVAQGQMINMRHTAEKPPLTKSKKDLLNQIIANENTIVYNGPTRRHLVGAGQTLYAISRIYNTSVDTLVAVNQLKSISLTLGQTIFVPVKETQIIEKDNISSSQYHIVTESETLYSISRKYGVTITQIKTLNELVTDELSIGLKLRIR